MPSLASTKKATTKPIIKKNKSKTWRIPGQNTIMKFAPLVPQYKLILANAIAGFRVELIEGNEPEWAPTYLGLMLKNFFNKINYNQNLIFPPIMYLPLHIEFNIESIDDYKNIDNIKPKFKKLIFDPQEVYKTYYDNLLDIDVPDNIYKNVYNWIAMAASRFAHIEHYSGALAIKVLQGIALIDGRTEVEINDLEYLEYMLYHPNVMNNYKLKQLHLTAIEMLEVVSIDIDQTLNPIRVKLNELDINIAKLNTAINNGFDIRSFLTDVPENATAASLMAEYAHTLANLQAELDDLNELAKRNSHFAKAIAELKDKINSTRASLMEKK